MEETKDLNISNELNNSIPTDVMTITPEVRENERANPYASESISNKRDGSSPDTSVKSQNHISTEPQIEAPVVLKKEKPYRKKENLKRFYTPKEWFNLLKQIKNEKHKFLIEFLLHTGARVSEARGVRITDIDFEREQIILRKTKGGIKKNRTIQISTYLTGRIKSYINSQKIESKLSTLNFPSTVMMDKMIKRYTMLSGLEDWKDFSNHNLRKTLENFLVALNINHLSIQAHMGHTLDVASAHYVATQLLNSEDKSLIRAILDNLLQK